jgi:undecaprenyl-diphosphatase
VDLDCRLFSAVARSRTAWLDRLLPRLSRSANHSVLWALLAGGMALGGGREGKRAAVRGVGSIGATSALVNLGVKRLVRRPRPSLRRVPVARRLAVQPLTTSFPSGHAASAAAFATAVHTEMPRLAWPVAALAAGVAYSRVYVGVHYPFDVLVGACVGAGMSTLSRLQWPAVPRAAREEPATDARRRVDPDPDGSSLGLVVNREAGSGPLGPDASDLTERLPGARVLEIDGGGELEAALAGAIDGRRVLGVLGGDGTATVAAAFAVEHERPLLLLPGGTLNHLARDLRLESAEQALDAFSRGEVVEVDVGTIDGRPFLNAVSFGAYTEMLEQRRKLEKRIGRWPAHAVAVAHALVRARPVAVVIEGRRRRLWMAFIGNCRHEPPGFAPSWRPRLDDGRLDVRLLLAERPLARVRLALSILTGRLTRSAAYERFEARELQVEADGPALRLARDGEDFDAASSFRVGKLRRGVLVYAPHRNA